jgi:phosphoglycerol geranylgeranyltransferase
VRQTKIYNHFLELRQSSKKAFVVLVDPDKSSDKTLSDLTKFCKSNPVDFIFVGGSILTETNLKTTISEIKKSIEIPVVIFPGAATHVCEQADGVLFLSLISGRNPEFLIGQHIIATPELQKSNIEVLPTAYLLIDGGKPTTVSYISHTMPIPADKPEIAATTALAGEFLGLKTIFLDAGSGANQSVSTEMIAAVRKNTSIPLIVGGGMKNKNDIQNAWNAGADIVVVGTALENSFSNFF